MDWEACIICGESSGDLKCPADSLSSNGLEIYTNFLEHVEEFRRLDALPVTIDFKGDGSAERFLEKRAKWHKACNLKFAPSKLDRVKKIALNKRKHKPSDEECRKSKRQASGHTFMPGCIFLHRGVWQFASMFYHASG